MRSSARSHISSSASSHWPMVRMQWCTRPGPRRAWASAKPPPSCASRFPAGTRTLRNTISQWPSMARWFITGMLRTISTPGVSIGTRIMLWRWCAGASGASFDTPITMASRQAGAARR
jgi:hypothetical protein